MPPESGELIEDITVYKEYPECRTVLFIIYDPYERLKKPYALLRDMDRKEIAGLMIRVIITPMRE